MNKQELDMTQEHKEILIRDLCGRLPYGVKEYIKNWSNLSRKYYEGVYTVESIDPSLNTIFADSERSCVEVIVGYDDYEIKPYLFPMSSMTEEQAKELSILYGIKDILSIKITDEYIDFEVDDGFCSIETKTIWYNEIISSIEIFDWLNKNHFDYRGLIPMELAINATNLNIY